MADYVPDVFDDVFDGIGDDFSDLCAGQKPVTVRSINPDTGATLETADDVTALKRSRRRQMFGVQGGELGSDQCRFILRASEVGFFVKEKDEIEDADSVVWKCDQVSAIGFNQLYACDVTVKR